MGLAAALARAGQRGADRGGYAGRFGWHRGTGGNCRATGCVECCMCGANYSAGIRLAKELSHLATIVGIDLALKIFPAPIGVCVEGNNCTVLAWPAPLHGGFLPGEPKRCTLVGDVPRLIRLGVPYAVAYEDHLSDHLWRSCSHQARASGRDP